MGWLRETPAGGLGLEAKSQRSNYAESTVAARAYGLKSNKSCFKILYFNLHNSKLDFLKLCLQFPLRCKKDFFGKTPFLGLFSYQELIQSGCVG